MTPEEKFNQEIWWTLQEIKKEQLATPKGEKVYFSLRVLPKTSSVRRKDVDYGFPQADTQRKLLYKLKEWKALDAVPANNILQESDIFNPRIYNLTIHQSKFDELYRLYESGGSYSENKNATPEIKTSQSIIKPKSLEFIAREIGNLETGTNLIGFLTDCGVDKKIIEYPQTKWRMVYDVFIALATSSNPKNQEILFKIIEEASHPLMHNGDENLTKETKSRFNKYLKYDGFQLHNFKIKRIADNIVDSKPVKTAGIRAECIEELAYELYKEAKKVNKASEEHSCIIVLQKVAEYPSSSGKDFADKTYQNTELTLSHFKKEGIIKDYSIKQCGTIVATTIDGKDYTTDGAEIKCKFNPKKAIVHLKILYEPKKLLVEKLAKLYLKLISIIELYFQKPIIRDEKLNIFYLKISDEINQLLNKNIITELDAYREPYTVYDYNSEGELVEELLPYKNMITGLKTPYHKPFSTLFSAQKEMEENETNLQAVINSLNAFYGEINKLVSLYDIKDKEMNVIEDLDKYINDLKTQKGKQKEEPLHVVIDKVKKDIGIKGLEEKMASQKSNKPDKGITRHTTQNEYKILVKDREIWVNDYLIGKPHAVGSNFEFFDYVRSQKPNTKINRDALPNFGNSALAEEVKNKSFIKMANELGFKGEILKAFFYNRSKDTLTYRGDKITQKDLEKSGIKISLFSKELELAHTKNSPE